MRLLRGGRILAEHGRQGRRHKQIGIRHFTLGRTVSLRRDAWFSTVDLSWFLLLQGQDDLPPSLGNKMIDKDETKFELFHS